MKKAIIILGAGSNQVILYQVLKKEGFILIGVDKNPEAIGFRFCDEKIVASTHEAGPIIEKLCLLQYRYIFDGVITRSSGPPLIVQAKIAEYFSLISVPLTAIEICSKKSTIVEFATINGVESPKRYTLDTLKSAPELFPVIIKPDVSILGKKDVRTVNSFAKLIDIMDNHKIGDIHIEQYIEGEDITCFACVYDGVVYPISFVEEWIGMSSEGDRIGLGLSVRRDSYETIEKATQKIVTALGLGKGIIVLDFRLNASIPYLIEMNLDIGGDYCFDYLLPYAGYNNPILHLVSPFLRSPLQAPVLPRTLHPSLMLYIFSADEMSDDKFAELERNVGKVILVDDNNKIRRGLVLLSFDRDVLLRIRYFDRILARKTGMEIQQFYG